MGDVTDYIFAKPQKRKELRSALNIHDVARETGVSAATVSRVINNSGYVKSETRKRVLEVIKRHNYIPSAVARSLSTRGTSNIGVIIPDIENSFFSGVIRSISEVAEQNGYNILFFGTNENVETEHRFLKTVREQRLRGVIITPVSEDDSVSADYLTYLNESGIPVVLVDRTVRGTMFDGVFIDNIMGAYDAVTELVRAGHTRIATIAGPETSKPGRDRLRGYKRALEDNGIPLCEEYIEHGDFKVEQGYKLTQKLLSLPQPPTALFTSNNMTTLGCVKYLVEKKYRIGRDISLLGFDDIEILNYIDFNLSVVSRAVGEMGVHAMRILMQRLAQEEPCKKPIQVVLPPSVILRGSERLG